MVIKIRLFLAVWLSPALHVNVMDLIGRLRPDSTGVKWVSPEQLHFTVKFLGDQPPSLVDKLQPKLEQLAESIPGFELVLGGGGTFPPHGEPRVLWLGLQAGAERLGSLATVIDDACAQCGVPKEERPFKPHLTLARVKLPPARFNRRLLDQGVQGRMQVEKFALIESKLSPGGPTYETLRTYKLAN